MKLLITGFQPFLGETENPSEQLARALGAELGVPYRILPVSYRRAFAELENALAENPGTEFCLMIGQAGGRRKIGLERVGVNYEHAESADEDGDRAQERPLVADGPLAVASTLPLVAWKDALVAAGFAVEVSHSTGTFVCNAVNYRALLRAEEGATRFLFVHVPHLPSQKSERFGGHDGMTLDRQLAGLRALVGLIRDFQERSK